MKKLEFKTSKGELVLIDLPKEAKHIEFARDSHGFYLCWHDGNQSLVSENFQHDQITISKDYKDSFRLSGWVKKMSEEDFADVVEWNEEHQFYVDYRIKDYTWYGDLTAKESFESLINSLGYYLFDNPYASSINEAVNKSIENTYESKLNEADIFREAD